MLPVDMSGREIGPIFTQVTKSLPLVQFWSEHREFLFMDAIPCYSGSVEGELCLDLPFQKMHEMACHWESPCEKHVVTSPFSSVSWFHVWLCLLEYTRCTV